MLLEFTVENYRSFGARQTLSMIPGRERTHQENLFKIEELDQRVLPAAAVFGANASGKSNLIRAIWCMLNIIRTSAIGLNPGDPLPDITPFRLDSSHTDEPSRFEILFSPGGADILSDNKGGLEVRPPGNRLLRYSFSATALAVTAESLREVHPSGSMETIFERNIQTDEPSWNFSKEIDEQATKLIRERTRNNALALSVGANLNIGELPRIYEALTGGIQAMDMAPPPPVSPMLIFDWPRRLNDDPALKAKIDTLIRDADIGIASLNVQTPAEPSNYEVEELRKQFGGIPPEFARKMLAARHGFRVTTQHRRADSDQRVLFDWYDESRGTKVFTAQAVFMLDALSTGKTVLVDEFASSMHPLLARRLIELFQNPENNKSGAQLIFATHDVTLMDQALFRRDQIWLTEKNSHGETELRSLADLEQPNRPRSTEAFARNYLTGCYGGVANFGPTLEGRPIEAGAGEK
jgi:AAA15 family ATPase/GTPase